MRRWYKSKPCVVLGPRLTVWPVRKHKMGEPPPEPLITLRGDMTPVHCLLFHLDPESESLYASTQSGTIHKWNLKTSREEYRVEVGDDCCLSVDRLGETFVTQEKGGLIKVWWCHNDIWTLKNKMRFDYWGFCKINVFDDKFIACPDVKSTVNVITSDGSIESRLYPPADKLGEIMALKCVKISGTNYVFVLYESGMLVLFKASGNYVSQLKLTSDCPMCLDFLGDKGVVGCSGDTIHGFRLTQDARLSAWKQASITNPGVGCVRVRPDGRVAVAGCWDGRLRVLSLKSLRLLAVLAGSVAAPTAPPVQALAYSPSPVSSWKTRWLLASTSDSRLSLWSFY